MYQVEVWDWVGNERKERTVILPTMAEVNTFIIKNNWRYKKVTAANPLGTGKTICLGSNHVIFLFPEEVEFEHGDITICTATKEDAEALTIYTLQVNWGQDEEGNEEIEVRRSSYMRPHWDSDFWSEEEGCYKDRVEKKYQGGSEIYVRSTKPIEESYVQEVIERVKQKGDRLDQLLARLNEDERRVLREYFRNN